MLLKFTSSDICDTVLVDCASGSVAYRTVTPRPPRARSGSRSTFSSLGGASKSMVDLRTSADEERTTSVEDADGRVVAEIRWSGNHASVIKIGDEVLQGTAELFDAAFIKIYPDETLLPTRMEYTWRTTPDDLTLLDDDSEVVGKLHTHCTLAKDQLAPARFPTDGHDYFQLDAIPTDEVLEIIVSCLLVKQLRERMYSARNYIPDRRDPLAKLRHRATRGIVQLRDSLGFRRGAA